MDVSGTKGHACLARLPGNIDFLAQIVTILLGLTGPPLGRRESRHRDSRIRGNGRSLEGSGGKGWRRRSPDYRISSTSRCSFGALISLSTWAMSVRRGARGFEVHVVPLRPVLNLVTCLLDDLDGTPNVHPNSGGWELPAE